MSLDPYEKFELLLTKEYGERIRSDDLWAKALWSALTNVKWVNTKTLEEVSYSFRSAGSLVAHLRGEGDYMDWYCGSKYATIYVEIKNFLDKNKWRPRDYQLKTQEDRFNIVNNLSQCEVVDD